VEDDIDWDVRLKRQLGLVAPGIRAIYPPASGKSALPYSPYGDDWDLLWLGHCGEPFPEDLEENKKLSQDDPGRLAMSRKYAILNDATVPPWENLTGLVDWKKHPEHTRWVHVTAAPICTFAYAVSLQGARKLLYTLSVDGLHEPFDNALAGVCRRSVGSLADLYNPTESGRMAPKTPRKTAWERGFDMKCASVTPPLFFHHRAKGRVIGDSDINKAEYEPSDVVDDRKHQLRKQGSTENIITSTRLNLQNLILGLPLESQF
jgi:hypothetical protein